MDHYYVRDALKNFKTKKVLVVGDIMLDHYTFGTVTRLSPEAPIPVLEKTRETYTLGGAANVARNARALGARATLVGVVGRDDRSVRVHELLREDGIVAQGVLTDATRPTTHKHRFIAGSHHVLRVDDESTHDIGVALEKRLMHHVTRAIDACDIIIFSDYAKGVFTKRTSHETIRAAREKGKEIIADVKPVNRNYFQGVHVISPNAFEARAMTGEQDVEKAGKALAKGFSADVVVTHDKEGIFVFPRGGNSFHHVPARKREVIDVSGAGDTSVAVFALARVSGLSLFDAAYLANLAGGIEVQKMGTATVSIEELEAELASVGNIETAALVPKLWGYEKWLENNDRYCSKVLSLKKDFQCSLHMHQMKDEMFIVTEGHVRLEIGKEVKHLRRGDFIRVPPGTLHRFRGVEDSTILEVSTHHDDADSHRLEPSRHV